MKAGKRILKTIMALLIAIVFALLCLLWVIFYAPFGFARVVSPEEETLRLQLVQTAEGWLELNEKDLSHSAVVDLYNSHTPLARNYEVTYSDDWCATFASAAAIQCGLTDIIPTECGCERQTLLFRELGRWEESDSYLPLPGDYIYYAWNDNPFGNCTGWSDHVGIVVGTWGPFIKVIEGNKNDAVAYRIIPQNHYEIRGFGLPDYSKKCG